MKLNVRSWIYCFGSHEPEESLHVIAQVAMMSMYIERRNATSATTDNLSMVPFFTILKSWADVVHLSFSICFQSTILDKIPCRYLMKVINFTKLNIFKCLLKSLWKPLNSYVSNNKNVSLLFTLPLWLLQKRTKRKINFNLHPKYKVKI